MSFIPLEWVRTTLQHKRARTWAAGWERGGATWDVLKCSIRTRLPVWICFRAPLQRRATRTFPPTRVDADQMSEPFKSLSRPPSEPEIRLCSAFLPEPRSDLFTLRVKPRILGAAERICSFAVEAQDKEGKLWGEPS